MVVSLSGYTLTPLGGVIAAAVGNFFGWAIGGTISRAKINKDYVIGIWLPIVKSRRFTLY